MSDTTTSDDSMHYSPQTTFVMEYKKIFYVHSFGKPQFSAICHCMCRMPYYCSTKRQIIDYCSKSKMDCKVLIGLCGLVHSYLLHSAGIMFQLV